MLFPERVRMNINPWEGWVVRSLNPHVMSLHHAAIMTAKIKIVDKDSLILAKPQDVTSLINYVMKI